jgi:ABC-type multidrug transport system ATPase subunit
MDVDRGPNGKYLACRGIDFFYPGTMKPIFKDFALELTEPGLHALFGPSGVGKTSLARLLIGRLAPAAGRIERRGLDTVFYSYNMERLPAWGNVGRHLARVTPPEKNAQRKELVSIFGLDDLLGQRFSQLSLGQQNRINLVRYLVQDFSVLIMDESLANVDEKTRTEILFAIKALYPHLFFIYISHNVVEVAKFCRRIWVLRGIDKSPQAVAVAGVDLRAGTTLDFGEHQRAMLEIMNAA